MSGVIKVTRMMLHEKMLEYREEPVEKRKNRVVEFLKESFRTNGNPMATKDLTQFMSQQFFAPYLKRWQDCSRTNSRFLQNNSTWLEQEIVFPQTVSNCLLGSLDLPSTSGSGKVSLKNYFINNCRSFFFS